MTTQNGSLAGSVRKLSKKARVERSNEKVNEVRAAKKLQAETVLNELTADFEAKWSGYTLLGRKTALAYWQAGKVLSKIRETVKATRKVTGLTWAKWCEDHNLDDETARQAIEVANALTEADIEGLDGITACKRAAGILKEPKKKLHVKAHTRSERGVGAQEVPPTHEPETVLGMLVQLNQKLTVMSSMPIADEDRDGVHREASAAMDLLSTMLSTVTTLKVAA